jgi:ABC-type multidrug transport system permease subunit
LGRIRFAVVDEDRSALTRMLRGAANQGALGDHLEPVFMERDAALKLINANKISAVLLIETNFMRNYLTAAKPVNLELIKNPAESVNPAVLEELLGVVVTGLNAVSRNFHADFPEWQRVFEGKEDYHKVSFLIDQAGDKLKAAKQFINPPLVWYDQGEAASGMDTSETNAVGAAKPEIRNPKSETDNIFAYLLLGMSAMFLLFLGQNAMTDLHRELRLRTFERYQTLHQQLWPLIFSKIVFAVVILLIGSAIMLLGGGFAFGIHWQKPLPLAALVGAYSCFIAALFSVLVAIMPDERRAGVLNNLAGMALALMGGCVFPPRQLPDFLREHITPCLPSYWFTDTARNLQSLDVAVPWGATLLKLMLCAVLLAALAAGIFRRRFKSGLRP